MLKIFVVISLVFTLNIYGKEFGSWTVKGNSSYRFAEQYGQQDVRLTGESYKQRLDFTFSKSKGWEMTLTTSYLATKDDTIKLILDDESYVFKGKGCCHKQTFEITKDIVKKIKNTTNDIVIEEIYSGGGKYRSVFSSKGSSAALLWVSDL